MMTPKKDMNRRELLKRAAGCGVLSVALLEPIAAREQFSESELTTVLNEPEVESIVDVVPNLRIHQHRGEVVDVGPKGTGDTAMFLKIPANMGTLTIAMVDGDVLTAIFEFQNRRPNLQFDWPRGTEAKLVGRREDALFVRSGTPEEIDRVANVIDQSPDEIQVETTHEWNGYRALLTAKEEDRIDIFRLEPDSPGVTTATQEVLGVVDSEVITPRKHSDVSITSCDCGEMVAHSYLCLHQLGSCSRCLSLTGLPGVGKGAAIVCALGTGCVSIADLFTGCSELFTSYDCLYDCLTSL